MSVFLAEDGLVQLHRVLAKVSSRTSEEEEFVVRMQSPWAKAQKEGLEQGLERGLQRGRKEGRTEGEARALLTVLRARGMTVPNAARGWILAEKDHAILERWLKRALQATSLSEVLAEPSESSAPCCEPAKCQHEEAGPRRRARSAGVGRISVAH